MNPWLPDCAYRATIHYLLLVVFVPGAIGPSRWRQKAIRKRDLWKQTAALLRGLRPSPHHTARYSSIRSRFPCDFQLQHVRQSALVTMVLLAVPPSSVLIPKNYYSARCLPIDVGYGILPDLEFMARLSDILCGLLPSACTGGMFVVLRHGCKIVIRVTTVRTHLKPHLGGYFQPPGENS
ncbi:hypothetical protein EJ03DRAFT_118488 [Teratosphaeria nubilosa]|uniref:Uncharacterized protein n=1 Tax=Teratosphaeria nubilosa TaxID=161662 RepID=A0A6G1L6M9_9PEZI|nr:hypothetical protein EJ03DRAFT_118488 [Teratosphaeria nubilosa]